MTRMGRPYVAPNGDIPLRVHFWVAITPLVLFPFKSETIEGVVSYNPQRVLGQFGYDQGPS